MVLSSYKAADRGARIDQEKGRQESLKLNFWTHLHRNWVDKGKFAEIEEKERLGKAVRKSQSPISAFVGGMIGGRDKTRSFTHLHTILLFNHIQFGFSILPSKSFVIPSYSI